VLAGSVLLWDASESMIRVHPLVPAVPEAERSASDCAESGTSRQNVAPPGAVGSLAAAEVWALRAW